MKTTTLRNLFLALSMCVGTVAIANTAAPASANEVVDAVFVLEQELLTAKTPAAVEAAKAKALAAGVPLKTVQSTMATTLPARSAANANVAQSQPAVKKSVSIGGSTTGSANSIPAGSTNIADTGSTYN
ncbi:hypothetical protein N9Z14_04495 [Opitutales bacterium]|nr:hypothetical protein [Opitutales bacterium]